MKRLWQLIVVIGSVAFLVEGTAAGPSVVLTLYVHEGNASGPLLPGAVVTSRDGAGRSITQTAGAAGYVTVSGTGGTWAFAASKAGYKPVSWTQSITSTCTKHAFLQAEARRPEPATPPVTAAPSVTLTLYVHDSSPSGSVLSGARVSGQDSAGRRFDQTTNAAGYITIAGTAGTWQFAASRSGYQSASWSQAITTSCRRDAFLQRAATQPPPLPPAQPPTLTLYVHQGSATGPLLSGVRVSGQDGAGRSFDQTTSVVGQVTLSGAQGTWRFTACKSGYQTSTWSQPITSTCTKHAFLHAAAPQPKTEAPSAGSRVSVALTLYVHDGSANGPLLSGVQVTGQDGDGRRFDQKTDSNGRVQITGAPWMWRFSCSKAGYRENSWGQLITGTCAKHAYLQALAVPPVVTTSPAGPATSATLTLYVHETAVSGPVLSGVRIIGRDGAGRAFDRVTSAAGCVELTGVRGKWQFTASKTGYQTNSWSQSIASVCRRDAFLQRSTTAPVVPPTPQYPTQPVTLTLHVHEGSARGPLLSGVRVTGQDSAGQGFDLTTAAAGYITIHGAPGTWKFTASKSGYEAASWSQAITASCRRDAFLQRTALPGGDVTLTDYTSQPHPNNAFDNNPQLRGYCTWYVADRWLWAGNQALPSTRNARFWLEDAQTRGFHTDPVTPVNGCIVVLGASQANSGGHVAYVESAGETSFQISQMNAGKHLIPGTLKTEEFGKVRKDSLQVGQKAYMGMPVLGFIHPGGKPSKPDQGSAKTTPEQPRGPLAAGANAQMQKATSSEPSGPASQEQSSTVEKQGWSARSERVLGRQWTWDRRTQQHTGLETGPRANSGGWAERHRALSGVGRSPAGQAELASQTAGSARIRELEGEIQTLTTTLAKLQKELEMLRQAEQKGGAQ